MFTTSVGTPSIASQSNTSEVSNLETINIKLSEEDTTKGMSAVNKIATPRHTAIPNVHTTQSHRRKLSDNSSNIVIEHALRHVDVGDINELDTGKHIESKIKLIPRRNTLLSETAPALPKDNKSPAVKV